jgi:RimJ/RimL family protein N-acetyltransferase
MPLVYGQDERVTAWVAAQVGAPAPPSYASIGFERDGELVAGVYFENYTGSNIFAHIAFSGDVFPRELIAAVYAYATVQLTCKRMTFLIWDNNEPCINFVIRMGASLEGRMADGHPKGDVYIFTLWHDNPQLCNLVNRILERN